MGRPLAGMPKHRPDRAEEKKRKLQPGYIAYENQELVGEPAPAPLGLTLKEQGAYNEARMTERKMARFNEQRASRHISRLGRRVLRVVDAIFPQGPQNHAVKTLIAVEFQNELSKVFRDYNSQGLGEEGEAGELDAVKAIERG